MRTRIVAITGGIASGKSTVGRILAEHGCIVIDSDGIARELTRPGSPALAEIVAAFGEEVLTDEGELDRPKVAEMVFKDEQKLRCLETILHPRIIEELHRRARESGRKWAFLLIPLLFERGLEDTVDVIWLCFAPEKVRLERAMDRDGARREDVMARMKAQIPDEEKASRADVVINTWAPLDLVEKQVLEALEELDRRNAG